MTKSSSLWILTALLATAPASAQESEGPISRFLGRFRSTPTHQHVHAPTTSPAPAPVEYVYVEAQPQAQELEAQPQAQAVEAAAPTPPPLADAAPGSEEGLVQEQVPQAEAAAPGYEPAYAYENTGCDPYGFVFILNRIRASAGLHPLAYDPNLSSWAHQNNAEQCRRGLGHHVNPGGLQNCAYNYTDADSTAAGWMNSPGHRQNMLSPSATHFGIAFGPGPYWTLNAR